MYNLYHILILVIVTSVYCWLPKISSSFWSHSRHFKQSKQPFSLRQAIAPGSEFYRPKIANECCPASTRRPSYTYTSNWKNTFKQIEWTRNDSCSFQNLLGNKKIKCITTHSNLILINVPKHVNETSGIQPRHLTSLGCKAPLVQMESQEGC